MRKITFSSDAIINVNKVLRRRMILLKTTLKFVENVIIYHVINYK